MIVFVSFIGGSGLFGTMLADKLARPLAEALVAQVNEIIERRDEAEAKAMRMLQNGGGMRHGCFETSRCVGAHVLFCSGS